MKRDPNDEWLCKAHVIGKDGLKRRCHRVAQPRTGGLCWQHYDKEWKYTHAKEDK